MWALMMIDDCSPLRTAGVPTAAIMTSLASSMNSYEQPLSLAGLTSSAALVPRDD